MLKTLIATTLLSFSTGSNSFRDLKPKSQDFYNRSSQILGYYNFRDFLDYNSFDSFCADNQYNEIEYTIELSLSGDYLSPCNINDRTGYVSSLEFYYDSDNVSLTINYYDSSLTNYELNIDIDGNANLSDFSSTIQGFIFWVSNPFYLANDELVIFDFFFTNLDNAYTTTYSGYYSFNKSISAITSANYFSAFGYSIFGNYTYNAVFTPLLPSNNDLSYVGMLYYDIYDKQNRWDQIDLPMTNISANILTSGWKMTKTSYNAMSRIGIFAYVHDTTYDDAQFSDLLFSIMDSPFYMISKFLNWQLFGVNLFVAFTGLLTICVILVLIRKFW